MSKPLKQLFTIYVALVSLIIFSALTFFINDPKAAKLSVGDWNFVSNAIMMETLLLIYLSFAALRRVRILEHQNFAKFMSFFSVFFLVEDYHWGKDILWIGEPKLLGQDFDCLHDLPNLMIEGLPNVIGVGPTILILTVLVAVALLICKKYSLFKKAQLIVDSYLPAKVFLVGLALFGLATFFDIAMKNVIGNFAEDFSEEIIESIAVLTLIFSVLTAERLDRENAIK